MVGRGNGWAKILITWERYEILDAGREGTNKPFFQTYLPLVKG